MQLAFCVLADIYDKLLKGRSRFDVKFVFGNRTILESGTLCLIIMLTILHQSLNFNRSGTGNLKSL